MFKPVTAHRTSSHPIYPRPVSPLQYEPLYNRPEDLLWDQDSESDDTEGVRAAKKRRIEKLGEAYLRGDNLFILSAGIRGPLGKGWRNPWMKKKGKNDRLTRLGNNNEAATRKPVAEVPETVERVPKELVEKEKAMNEMRDSSEHQQRSVQVDKKAEVAAGPPYQDNPFVTARERLSRDKTTAESGSNRWLKNGVTLTSNRDVHTEKPRKPPLSPSTRFGWLRPAEESLTPSSDEDLSFKTGPTVATSSSGRAETAIKLLRRPQAASPVPFSLPRVDVVEAEARGYIDSQCSGGKEANPKKNGQPAGRSVAEGTSGNGTVEQNSIHSPSCVEQTMPSPPVEGLGVEDRNFSDEPTPQPKNPTSDVPQANDQLGSQPSLLPGYGDIQYHNHLKQECEKQVSSNVHQPRQSMPAHTLSTETSGATVISTMPSAQVATMAQAPPPNESVPSTGDKLSEQHHGHDGHDDESTLHRSTQTATAAANRQLQNGLTTPQVTDATAPKTSKAHAPTLTNKQNFKSGHSSGITPFSAFNKPSRRSSTQNSPNTQEVLEAVTPVETATTAKKLPLIHRIDSASPTNTANAVDQKEHKWRKRASFAPDGTSTGSNSGSSQGSIKASLKVRKHVADQACCANEAKDISADHLVPSEFGKLGLDMETSDEDTKRPPEKQAQATERSSVAPVLKPASTSSTSKTSAPRQDAQDCVPRLPPILNHRILHQRHGNHTNQWKNKNVNNTTAAGLDSSGLEDIEHGDADADADADADFDLSAAMDEVGSFLQSWDTEKEIKAIRNENEMATKTTLKAGEKSLT